MFNRIVFILTVSFMGVVLSAFSDELTKQNAKSGFISPGLPLEPDQEQGIENELQFDGVFDVLGMPVKKKKKGKSATVGGGKDNKATGDYATVGGGRDNEASGKYATVGGGTDNEASGRAATIAGGEDNRARAKSATVGGGKDNKSKEEAATIAGGESNRAEGEFATVGGGLLNTAGADFATVSGGVFNEALAEESTVGGGCENVASGSESTISGGEENRAQGEESSIGGGGDNTAGGKNSTVAGGAHNFATGDRSAIPGGFSNVAQGDGSFAAGRHAHALHDGSFVWGDTRGATSSGQESAGDDTFNVYAQGGIYLNGVVLHSSDRNLKEDFTAVSGRDVLAKVLEMPITTWRFKSEDDSVLHIGPVAQDFMAAFGYGVDDTHITATDADGVALAAIQGLNEKLDAKDATIESQGQMIATLESRLRVIEQVLTSLTQGLD